MYNIFVRYKDTVKLVETDEELFNLQNKSNYLAAIQWDDDNQFDETCDEVDRRVLELSKSFFNLSENDDLELVYYKPIGEDNLFSYCNVLIINNNDESKDWGKDLEMEELMKEWKSWNTFCDNLPLTKTEPQ